MDLNKMFFTHNNNFKRQTMKSISTLILLLSFTFSTQAEDNLARVGFIQDATPALAATKGGAESEGFDDISILTDWTIDNQSNPVGGSDWFQGNELVFNAQSGADSSYIAANFSNSTGTEICNWLVLPDLGFLQNFSFWTRTTVGATFADRLLVLHSPTGGTNTGDCINGFGDFTDTLTEVNPTLATGGYPEDWIQYSQLIDATGRVAFVYFVEDTANNGNYIGIDNVQWVSGLPQADLELNSSFSPDTNLQIGSLVTVTHTLTNNGPRDASGVSVDISLPQGLAYTSNNCGATNTDSTISWIVGDIANGSNMICNVVVEVTENGQQFYLAQATGTEVDSNINNNNNGFNINGPAAIIPTLNSYGLMFMTLLMLILVWRFKIKSEQ